MSDGLRLILVFLLFVAVPFAACGLWWWFGTWLAVGLVLSVAEISVKLVTGRAALYLEFGCKS